MRGAAVRAGCAGVSPPDRRSQFCSCRALSTWCRECASPSRGRPSALVQRAHVTASHSTNARVRSKRWCTDRSRCRPTWKRFCTTPWTDAKRCNWAADLKPRIWALALSGRLMRDLGAVVRVPICAVDHGRHHRTACGLVAAELVPDQPSWDTALAFQEFPEESHGCLPIPSRLHEDVDDVAVLVHSAPQILLATLHRDEQFVQMPGVTHPTAAAPKTSRVNRTEALTPLPNGFIGDRNAPLREPVLHIPEAETEAMVEDDQMAWLMMSGGNRYP